LLKGKNAFEDAGWFNKLFFSWVYPIMMFAKNNQLDIKQLGKVRQRDSVEV